MNTYTGSFIDPMNLKVEDIDIEDIAHALSLENRFLGRTSFPYSVSQHSILVASKCTTYKLEGLLHDAPEAYCKDIPSPIKKAWREQGITFYDDLEDKIAKVIAQKFNLAYPWPEEVEYWDKEACEYELDFFFRNQSYAHIYKMKPKEVKKRFLSMFDDLMRYRKSKS